MIEHHDFAMRLFDLLLRRALAAGTRAHMQREGERERACTSSTSSGTVPRAAAERRGAQTRAHLMPRICDASLRDIVAAKPPSVAFAIIWLMKAGILKALPMPRKPAAAAVNCRMTSGLALTDWAATSAPRAAYAAAATPQPIRNGVAMCSQSGSTKHELHVAKLPAEDCEHRPYCEVSNPPVHPVAHSSVLLKSIHSS